MVEKDTVLFELYKKHQKYIEDLFDSCAFCVGIVLLILWDFNFNNSISHQLMEYLFRPGNWVILSMIGLTLLFTLGLTPFIFFMIIFMIKIILQ